MAETGYILAIDEKGFLTAFIGSRNQQMSNSDNIASTRKMTFEFEMLQQRQNQDTFFPSSPIFAFSSLLVAPFLSDCCFLILNSCDLVYVVCFMYFFK